MGRGAEGALGRSADFYCEAFGRTGTFLWVDPEAGLALACLTDLTFGEWAREAWPRLADAVLDVAGLR